MAWRNFKWTLFRITIQSSVKFWILMLEIIWQPTVIEFLCIKQSTELIYGEIKETVLFFMQYMNNLNVTDIVDCSIMNVLIYVMWRINYLIIFYFCTFDQCCGKGSTASCINSRKPLFHNYHKYLTKGSVMYVWKFIRFIELIFSS